MLLFHDPVSAIQFFGFSVALGGLVYYQLGGAPAFIGYWQSFRSEYGAPKTIHLDDRSTKDLEAQSRANGSVESLPEMKMETKHS